MMTSANHIMIVEMSKTVVICRLSFLYSKLLVDFLWKGHLRTAKCSILPQQKCNFVSPELRAKVSFFPSSAKFAKFVEDFACDAFATNSSTQVVPKFWKVFVCANALEFGFFQNQQRSIA